MNKLKTYKLLTIIKRFNFLNKKLFSLLKVKKKIKIIFVTALKISHNNLQTIIIGTSHKKNKTIKIQLMIVMKIKIKLFNQAKQLYFLKKSSNNKQDYSQKIKIKQFNHLNISNFLKKLFKNKSEISKKSKKIKIK